MNFIIDVNHTIVVTREKNKFVILNMATGEKVSRKDSEFYGSLFKSENDFLSAFKKTFSNDKNIHIVLSYEAADFVSSIMMLNRVDY